MKTFLSFALLAALGSILPMEGQAAEIRNGGHGGGGAGVSRGAVVAGPPTVTASRSPVAAPQSRAFAPAPATHGRGSVGFLNASRTLDAAQSQPGAVVTPALRPPISSNRATFSGNRGSGGAVGYSGVNGREAFRRDAGAVNRNALALNPRIYERWNRNHDYAWNHHRYRWSGNQWFIVGTDPYYYDYQGPIDAFDQEAPVYDSPSSALAETETSGAISEETNTDSLTVDVQRALGQAGYYHGLVDGILGPGTRAAITEYEADHSLEANGRITEPLVRSLKL